MESECEAVYASVQPKWARPASVAVAVALPVRSRFLVSFVVDRRGGAMTGTRAAGLRIIVPPDAVTQPTKVIARFVDKPVPHFMPGDDLAAPVLELSPNFTDFHSPVLLQVPYFVPLDSCRELAVLRSDDGRVWREVDVGLEWEEADSQVYADMIFKTGMCAALQDLGTARVCRMSVSRFPRYLCVVARYMEFVGTVSPAGGTIATNDRHVKATFPADAVQRKIKVGLRSRQVATSQLVGIDRTTLQPFPLVSVAPAARRFRKAFQITVPDQSPPAGWKMRLFYSTEEDGDLSEVPLDGNALVRRPAQDVAFSSQVSGSFWLVCAAEDEQDITATLKVLRAELWLTPMAARLTVLYRACCPHAWCSMLTIYCSCLEHDNTDQANWKTVISNAELTLLNGVEYALTVNGDVVVSSDDQFRHALANTFVFRPFAVNMTTLLITNDTSKETKKANIIISRKRDSVKQRYTLHSTWNIELE